MTKTKNALNWFEINVSDFERARTFYQTILNETMPVSPMQGGRMALFPFEMESGVGGAITQMEGCAAEGGGGGGGTVVYLNVEGDLEAVLKRVPEAGGKVVLDRMAIPPHGFIGIFQDPEGNKVGLHSMT